MIEDCKFSIESSSVVAARWAVAVIVTLSKWNVKNTPVR